MDDDRPVFSGEDPDEMPEWATRTGGRYTGAERAEAFDRRTAVPGGLPVA